MRMPEEENLLPTEDVLSRVSHDLRTPLAVVHTTTSLLLNPKYQLTPEQVREQLERIRRNVELMNRMLGELADLAHLRAGKLSINPKPIDVNEPLREAVAAQEAPAREKGLTLSYDAGTDALRASADRGRLAQLFQSLLGNALETCKAGDRITVTSRAHGNTAQIEVADSGPGIPAADLPHVFEPRYSGTGFGLCIAKGIVDAHGGQIRCVSEAGAGTTFTCKLPLMG
jgi:signal transduction histidine kinase